MNHRQIQSSNAQKCVTDPSDCFRVEVKLYFAASKGENGRPVSIASDRIYLCRLPMNTVLYE